MMMMSPLAYGGGPNAYGAGGGTSNPYLQAGSEHSPSNTSAKPPVTKAGNSGETLGLLTEGGRLSWPLGLRMLAPASQAQELRRQVDALVRIAATQAGGGTVQPATVEATTAAVGQLRALLHQQSGSAAMAEQTALEARRFLDRIERTLQAITP
jgi:hypothetical protein